MNNENELTAALATIEKLRAERDLLAAENVALKSSRAILSENALESCNSIACAGFRHEAIMRGLYASTGNGNKYPKPITTLVDEAMRKLETPATDRIVAGIKADGVEEFLKGSQLPYKIATVLADYDNADDETLLHVIWSGQPPEPEGDVWHLEYVSRGNAIVREVLKQLREGADK